MTAPTREPSPASDPKPAKLLDQVRHAVRLRRYSRRTEQAYLMWIRRFIIFHDKRHPAEMGEAEVTRFLSHLAVRGRVSASTQNQALNALLFLYKEVLRQDLAWMKGIVRAKRPRRLPVVLARDEVRALFEHLRGMPRLMALLMYGAGLRLLECAQLRVKDIDLAAGQIVVRSGKGDKDRVVILPGVARTELATQLALVGRQHRRDVARGAGWVELPFYASILWLFVCGSVPLRRYLRIRRGLCPACCYPMGNPLVCTECGKPLPKRAVA